MKKSWELVITEADRQKQRILLSEKSLKINQVIQLTEYLN